jgi:hypothetical protein
MIHPCKIILDTDMSTDVDDAGALAMLHALADNSEAEILAMMHNTGHPLGVPIIDIINSYYERSVPIGAFKGDFENDAARSYLKVLVDRFQHRITRDSAPDATQLYRKVLSSQPDNSTTIVSIGFLTNLASLLDSSPDEYSELSGKELVARKAKQLVIQGGKFPRADVPTWNFAHADAAPYTKKVLDNWPAPMVFSGYEVGISIMTGKGYAHSPDDNPLKLAYYHFFDELFDNRASWDQTCVLYAVRGCGELFREVRSGSNMFDLDGLNHWTTETVNSNHCYLEKDADDQTIAAVIEGLMLQPPRRMRNDQTSS